jgi:hypothetical protein
MFQKTLRGIGSWSTDAVEISSTVITENGLISEGKAEHDTQTGREEKDALAKRSSLGALCAPDGGLLGG